MLLLFPREPLSEPAVRALVARYGDGDGYAAWVTRQRDSEDPDDMPRMGDWRCVDGERRFDVLDAIAVQVCPESGFRLRARDPAPSDCGDDGWCRCGCGLGVAESPLRIAIAAR